MRWILLDALVAVLAIILLVLVSLGLWRRIKALNRQVGQAGVTIGQATGELDRRQAERGAGRQQPDGYGSPGGRRSV